MFGYLIELARRLTDGHRSECPDNLFRLRRMCYTPLVSSIEEASVLGMQAAARAADVVISSVGLIEDIVQYKCHVDSESKNKDRTVEVQVEDNNLSVNTSSHQEAGFLVTFPGFLNLYMTYNEAFHRESGPRGLCGEG